MLDPQIFIFFMLSSCLYHLLGNADVTMEPQAEQTTMPPDIMDDVIIMEPVADGNMVINNTMNKTGPTELPVFWEFTASLMVQAYAGIVSVES